jgi:hypothetical protein
MNIMLNLGGNYIVIENKYFSKIPNSLFYKKDGKSIFKIIKDYNALFVLDYIYMSTNRRNQVKFTIEDIVKYCGLKPDKHSGKSNDKIKNILIKLKELKLIVDDIDYSLLGTKGYKNDKDLLYTTPELFKKDKSGNDTEFVILSDEEKYKIMNDNIAIDKLKLLFYYLYLKSRIFKRDVNDDELYMTGGKSESAYINFEKINKDTLFTADTINKYNETLNKSNLIRYGRAEHWYYKNDPNKTIRESCNVYVLYNDGKYETNLKEGIKQYKLHYSEQRVFTKSEYTNNNRRINGKIGRLSYLERMGKATEEQIKEKNELVKQVETEKKKYVITEILNKSENEGKLLSEIEDDSYSLLEKSLGLVNSNNKLLVDWDYYKWVMTNYSENKHEFYTNCISKHIENSIDFDEEMFK